MEDDESTSDNQYRPVAQDFEIMTDEVWYDCSVAGQTSASNVESLTNNYRVFRDYKDSY